MNEAFLDWIVGKLGFERVRVRCYKTGFNGAGVIVYSAKRVVWKRKP